MSVAPWPGVVSVVSYPDPSGFLSPGQIPRPQGSAGLPQATQGIPTLSSVCWSQECGGGAPQTPQYWHPWSSNKAREVSRVQASSVRGDEREKGQLAGRMVTFKA